MAYLNNIVDIMSYAKDQPRSKFSIVDFKYSRRLKNSQHGCGI